MWLLDASTLRLDHFPNQKVPSYAILSHTWGDEEVSFNEMRQICDSSQFPEKMKSKKGFAKVQGCCSQATLDGLHWVWIDTCCIDKQSSAELSEAINSMFKWYKDAESCYVYLSDVPGSEYPDLGSTSSASSSQQNVFGPKTEDPFSLDVWDDPFSKSRWFTRGWTLQELIAPMVNKFFSEDWRCIGIKRPWDGGHREPANDPDSFISKLARITGIEADVLRDPEAIQRTSVAHRMAWAARRQTTRPEDMSYSLMGLFDVNMPILYGEGLRKAFKRLQREIIDMLPDQTIFAWRSDKEDSGLLADSPADFAESGSILPVNRWATTVRPYFMTNLGLSINLPLCDREDLPDSRFKLAVLRCWIPCPDGESRRVRIYLRRIVHLAQGGSVRPIYRRRLCHELELVGQDYNIGSREDIYILEDEQYQHIAWIDNLYT
jgi:hypothetical protein